MAAHVGNANRSEFMLCINFTFSVAWLMVMVLKLNQPFLGRTSGELTMMKMVESVEESSNELFRFSRRGHCWSISICDEYEIQVPAQIKYDRYRMFHAATASRFDMELTK